MSKLPPLHCNPSFNAQHSPMGAFMSFTCGHFGTRGGIGLQIGKPANQDVYIGVKEGGRKSDAPLHCLPFYEGATTNAASAFQVEQANKDAGKPAGLLPCRREQIQRFYGWTTDRWITPAFTFSIYTPFGSIPDPDKTNPGDMRTPLFPGVIASLEIDNTAGKMMKTGVFALNFGDAGVRILDGGDTEKSGHRVGFIHRRQMGVMGHVVSTTRGGTSTANEVEDTAFPICSWSVADNLRDINLVHLLGSCPGIAFEVSAGQRRTLVLCIGVYVDGVVTSGLEGRYLYTRSFNSLADVLHHGLDTADQCVNRCEALDSELLAGGLSADQQFLIAHATRSYYGSTELLDVAGSPYWIVNEGEYCMINTLDLSVDQLFWELRQNPWVVRNILDNFARWYSYQDEVKDPKTNKLSPGGVSFSHDQGIHNNFSPFGHSTYELANLGGCFSHMTQEQLCNWSLMAASYVTHTNNAAWARGQEPLIQACLLSMMNRDHPDPAKRDGVMGFDSSRCGTHTGNQEITTYDSLDHSLAQSRNNLYLAVKCWATYLGLALLFDRLGSMKAKEAAIGAAKLAQATIVGQMQPEGFMPAVFEKDNPGYASRILPAVEGLVYPLYWSKRPGLEKEIVAWIKPDGPFAPLLDALRRHTQTLLNTPGTNAHASRFADGGVKLSSTSNNSWMSKIAIVQHVCREVFNIGSLIPGGTTWGDEAHVKWQTEGTSAYWAMSDQMVNGVAQGSKYYPRCVTNTLWLNERG